MLRGTMTSMKFKVCYDTISGFADVWSLRGWLLLTPVLDRTSAYILTTTHRSSCIMAEIEIFLSIDETQMSFLSIPRSNIESLAVSPFQYNIIRHRFNQS
jgi:hypothetical protein